MAELLVKVPSRNTSTESFAFILAHAAAISLLTFACLFARLRNSRWWLSPLSEAAAALLGVVVLVAKVGLKLPANAVLFALLGLHALPAVMVAFIGGLARLRNSRWWLSPLSEAAAALLGVVVLVAKVGLKLPANAVLFALLGLHALPAVMVAFIGGLARLRNSRWWLSLFWVAAAAIAIRTIFQAQLVIKPPLQIRLRRVQSLALCRFHALSAVMDARARWLARLRNSRWWLSLFWVAAAAIAIRTIFQAQLVIKPPLQIRLRRVQSLALCRFHALSAVMDARARWLARLRNS